ncbi:siroheme synthase CysG [Aquicoccus sp. G2-2]|uniref:siroheme synthase CysG n=1 Tax=Aquicoccus sp. G2-2 TaxID=3092120 RepID=UPI002AE06B5E|nr:siroheme synthase CysG [Aquicoccus sp. G2-2]MEA1115271.1 siroheme synthase CysG [Aquicoccus sp. G2-2]
MNHYPIFADLTDKRVTVAGGGEVALAKLRLLLKTRATLEVFSASPAPTLTQWAAEGRLTLIPRALAAGDVRGALLFYAANEAEGERRRTAEIARAEGALVNIVDQLDDSDFITPAIVDRAPLTIAIATEGAAPVLARALKAKFEALLPQSIGRLAQIGKRFRSRAAALPAGRAQRDFWADYYFNTRSDTPGNEEAAFESLLDAHLARTPRPGHVSFVGAGPGDPELLTLKARKALDTADVVIHDRLVSAPVLELCRREAVLIAAGKQGFGPSIRQSEINALMLRHAREGAQVVRLKGGDPTVFGRLDEEIDALDAQAIGWSIIPGITAASASVAALGQSLTKRGRNHEVRLMTAHDMQGFAEQDWRGLARRGEVTAIYMGKRAARFIQGRLLMHGADPSTPVSIVENASHPEQRIIASTLAQLAADISRARLSGPALTLVGLAPRAAQAVQQKEVAL